MLQRNHYDDDDTVTSVVGSWKSTDHLVHSYPPHLPQLGALARDGGTAPIEKLPSNKVDNNLA